MLVQLTISNFAIIKELDIDFQAGLNILSGETGAGKSIIINAVNLILGGRASSDIIRTGSDEARVEALFRFPENSSLKEIMTEMGFAYNGELIIKRIISREGRNRIIINDSMATLQMLSNVGTMLLSISGQHEHQTLLRPENHLYLLDDFGGLTDDRLIFYDSFKRFESLMDIRKKMENEIKEGREKQELTTFQIKEIEDANISEGEDNLFEEERNRLKHAEELKTIISRSYQTLYEREDSVLAGVALCIKGLEKGADFDNRVKAIGRVLESAKAELEEAGLALRDLRSSISNDPFRLEEVEERLQLLRRLKRKYGPSLADIFRFKEDISGLLDDLDQKELELEKINKEIMDLEAKLVDEAIDLSKKRRGVAKKLEIAVESELALLDMGETRFQVQFDPKDLIDCSDLKGGMNHMKPEGFDNVEFLISPNVGEDLRPLVKIASGGELSRILLALKTILARETSIDTVIFDEVDSGIGGGTAEVVGEKLRFLSEYHQILCITHLPQIACQGETHFLVKKGVKKGRTLTYISRLQPEQRVNEIARLLGGKVVSEQAKAHAREMLG